MKIKSNSIIIKIIIFGALAIISLIPHKAFSQNGNRPGDNNIVGESTKLTDWIIAAGTFITGISVFLVWYQNRLEHERARRENALNHALRWTQIDRKTDLASRIGGVLTEEQIKKLDEFKSINIDAKYKDFIEQFFQIKIFNTDNKQIELTSSQVEELRYYLNYWFNTLESILIAYRLSIADKQILKEEFKGCLFKGQGKSIEFVLEKLFKEFGKNNTFPALEQFIKEIKTNEEKKMKRESAQRDSL